MAKRILIADDEPDIIQLVTFRLEKSGYEVLSAANGKEALDLIQTKKPDLVLLDLRMPIIDGYEVCRQVKADQALKDTPIILLTASSVIKLKEKVTQLKAEDYIIKPFSAEELSKKIEKFIK